MSINKTQLLTQLEALLDTSYTAGSTSVDDVVSTALSLNLLSETNIITVDSINSLPNLQYYDSPNGMVYFVSNLAIFALSSGSKWLTLDGRLLRQDTVYGDVLSWGPNSAGQLGNNNTIGTSSPVSLVGKISDWCQVSAGESHSLAVRSNCTLWTWGCNGSGRLGNNTTANTSSPVSVVGGFTDWCQASAGASHSLAVRTNGTLWAWGSNICGRLGDNTTTSRSSPVSVVGEFTDWCQASAGFEHSLAVRTDGSVWAWGLNSAGRLGDSTGTPQSSPVSVVGGFTDWCQVSAGGIHSLAVRTNGTLWAWGRGSVGQVGDNTTNDQFSPVSVVGGFTDWCQVYAGQYHSLAIRTNGTLWAWGCNGTGRLGDDTTTNKSSPVSVVGGFTDWCQVSAGFDISLAVRTNGTLWAWGSNNSGRLGDNTVTNRSSPVSVVGGFTDWCQASAGSNLSLGIKIC